MCISTCGRKLYVACVQAHCLSIIDTIANSAIKVIADMVNPHSANLDIAEERIFVTNSGSNSVAVVALGNERRVDVPVMRQPRSATMTPSGDLLYVANIDSAHVSVIDTARCTEVGRIPVGSHPNGIAVDPSGHSIYVSNSSANTVSVIAQSSSREEAVITVGDRPMAIGSFIH